jgi:RPA family protein
VSSADEGDDGPGRREVAHRLFAAEFDDATVSYRESDEERAPNYVVTPTGARVNRLFAVGVLTEVEPVNEDVVRARVADPTGVFVSYAGQYQPDALAFYERADPPAFVALTGKARTFEPEDGDRIYTSVRPESINEVDADTRDRWVVAAAEATLERVEVMRDALGRPERGDDLRTALADAGVRESLAAGVPVALERYDTTSAYLDAVREMAIDALAVVADERDAVRPLDVAPDEGDGATVGSTPDPDGRVANVPAADAENASDDGRREEPTDSGGEPTDVTETDASEPSDAADSGAPSREGGESAAVGATGTSDAGADPTDDAVSAGTAGDASTPDAGSASTDDGAVDTGDGATDDGADDVSTGVEDDTAAGTGDGVGGTDPLGDFELDEDVKPDADADGVYEMDDDERREVEEEFGTEFATGTEVDDPGEADIDVPDPEPAPESGAEADDAGADGTPEGTEPRSAAEGADADDDADADAGDLEDAAVAAMADLDAGDGADREAVVAAVVDDYGADPAAVEDAIQDALMSGRCYEPDEATLKPI